MAREVINNDATGNNSDDISIPILKSNITPLAVNENTFKNTCINARKPIYMLNIPKSTVQQSYIHIDFDSIPSPLAPRPPTSCSGAALQSEGGRVKFCSMSGREIKFSRRYSEYV